MHTLGDHTPIHRKQSPAEEPTVTDRIYSSSNWGFQVTEDASRIKPPKVPVSVRVAGKELPETSGRGSFPLLGKLKQRPLQRGEVTCPGSHTEWGLENSFPLPGDTTARLLLKCQSRGGQGKLFPCPSPFSFSGGITGGNIRCGTREAEELVCGLFWPIVRGALHALA